MKFVVNGGSGGGNITMETHQQERFYQKTKDVLL